MARVYVLLDCSVDLQPYRAGQVIDVSDGQAALLLRAAPTSFSTEDPAQAQAPEGEPPEAEQKALTEPPADKMVKEPAKRK